MKGLRHMSMDYFVEDSFGVVVAQFDRREHADEFARLYDACRVVRNKRLIPVRPGYNGTVGDEKKLSKIPKKPGIKPASRASK